MAYLVVCDGRSGTNQIWYDSENPQSIREAIEQVAVRLEKGREHAEARNEGRKESRPAVRRVSMR
jgi:hypothetical protein